MDDSLQPQYSLKRLSPRSPSTITMAGDIHDNSDAIGEGGVKNPENLADVICERPQRGV